jgi:hypothetical protein
MSEREETEKIFTSIRESLPQGWLELSEDLKLHHLLHAINLTLRPTGTWILVNGDQTLLQLLSEKANGD